MGNTYSQLSVNERIELYHLHANGTGLRRIATALGRSPSTISRELKRNSQSTKVWAGGYDPVRAETLAQRRRRWDCRFKLERQPDLRNLVKDCLAMGWSPEQIAGWLAQKNASISISHESIYRYIYHRSAQKDYWHKLLPGSKYRRGKLGKQGGSPVLFIKNRVGISERPECINLRQRPGDWEADLMLFRKYGQALLITQERASRLLLVHRQPNKTSQAVLDALRAQLLAFPAHLRQSMTFDNGTEFFLHYQLNGGDINMDTYFCDVHAPWQKGGIENAIGRLRRGLPRKSDLAAIPQEQIDQLVLRYNTTPRKCLKYRTPAEVFLENFNPLHFKREFTLPPSRE